MKVKLIDVTNNGINTVANAGRLCYSATGIDEMNKKYNDEDNAGLVQKILSSGHSSIAEHMSFTFAIEGVSRSLTHQLVRHRMLSFSQQSQRYVSAIDFEYVIPKDIRGNSKAYKAFTEHMDTVNRVYNELVDELLISYLIDDKELVKTHYGWYLNSEYALSDDELFSHMSPAGINLFKASVERKQPKKYKALEKRAYENARAVLPNATETKIIVSGNARALREFFALRCCRRAQDEIRGLAWRMLAECKRVAEPLFATAGAPCMYGACPEGSMSCGKPIAKEEGEFYVKNIMWEDNKA